MENEIIIQLPTSFNRYTKIDPDHRALLSAAADVAVERAGERLGLWHGETYIMRNGDGRWCVVWSGFTYEP